MQRVTPVPAELASHPSWTLPPRGLADLEMLATGGFAPLAGFMDSATVASVRSRLRLPDGTLWPMPIVLDLPPQVAELAQRSGSLVLRDIEGSPLAVVRVSETWDRDREAEAADVFGTLDPAHPGVASELGSQPAAVAGPLELLALPPFPEFADLRRSPAELRLRWAELEVQRVVAFQTRNPMHRAHFELTRRAASDLDAHLLVHPVIGPTMPGDLEARVRVACYRAILPRYPAASATLAVVPLAMRMAGPREALWHAIVRRNYGATHFILGRDHAGPGAAPGGKPFYEPYAAQELVAAHRGEIGIEPVFFEEFAYDAEAGEHLPVSEARARGRSTVSLSGTEMRRRLAAGEPLPAWFTFPEVARVLSRRFPPRAEQGFTVLLTGLSGAGKSTVARALERRLAETSRRAVTLLDGDEVRRFLSSELGFSRQHRDLNVRRIGYVAAEVTRAGGIAICAPIAPYDAVRKEVRSRIEPLGGFLLVWVATPIEVCERRDPKGLYAAARAGKLPQFTGVSDPYEPPDDAELRVDTSSGDPESAADAIVARLTELGFLPDS